jgi:hypothetical protein
MYMYVHWHCFIYISQKKKCVRRVNLPNMTSIQTQGEEHKGTAVPVPKIQKNEIHIIFQACSDIPSWCPVHLISTVPIYFLPLMDSKCYIILFIFSYVFKYCWNHYAEMSHHIHCHSNCKNVASTFWQTVNWNKNNDLDGESFVPMATSVCSHQLSMSLRMVLSKMYLDLHTKCPVLRLS